MFRIIKWLIALPIGIFIFFNAYVYGNIITYRAVAPSKTAFMSMRMSQFAKEGRDVELDYRWVPYDQISVNLKKALIASEDANFAEHSGFDWNGIKYAMKRNKQSGEVKAGGSTISQQLAKNLFLNESRSYIRKGEEAAITAMMEAVTDKDRIFEAISELNRMALRRIRCGSGIPIFLQETCLCPHPPTSRQTHGTRSGSAVLRRPS